MISKGQASHITSLQNTVFCKMLGTVKEAIYIFNKQLEKDLQITEEDQIYLKPVENGLQLKIPPTTFKKLDELKWVTPTLS